MIKVETLSDARCTWALVADDPAVKEFVLSKQCDHQCDDQVEQSQLGRGQTIKIIFSDKRCGVLRHLRHGGFLKHFIDDLFLGPSRVLKEFFLLVRAQEIGAPVPRVLAAKTQRYYGLFYRGDLLTEEIPSQTLGQLIQNHAQHDLKPLLRLILSLHRSGLEHVDLNVNNILIPDDGSQWVAIDFDRARLHKVLPLNKRLKSILRLDRSYEKKFGFAGPISPLRRYRIWHHYLKNIGIPPKEMLPFLRREQALRKWHRLGWHLKGLV